MKILIAIAMVVAWAFGPHAARAQSGEVVPISRQHDHAGHDSRADQHFAKPNTRHKDRQPDAGPHGGGLQQVGELRVETLVQPGGVRLFAYHRNGQPLEMSQVRGLATLHIEGNTTRYRYDLFPAAAENRSSNSLAVAVDLAQFAGRKVDIAFQLVGLHKDQRTPVRFTASTAVPMNESQRVAAGIAEQQVCPVSGKRLGAMGKPIAVTNGDQTVYVCCAGCVDAVKEDFAIYSPRQQVKLTVTKATEADAEAIALQQVCPVMEEPLGSMGTPTKVTGLGRDVFLCCQGCVKFLEKDPQKFLASLPLPESAKSEVRKATKRDSQFVAAQQFCPVMDEPLAAMGGPYRTVVEGKIIYLCCPGCAKKLHANPSRYLGKLAKLGVKPPTVK